MTLEDLHEFQNVWVLFSLLFKKESVFESKAFEDVINLPGVFFDIGD